MEHTCSHCKQAPAEIETIGGSWYCKPCHTHVREVIDRIGNNLKKVELKEKSNK